MAISELLSKINSDLKTLHIQINQVTEQTVEILKEVKDDLAESKKNRKAIKKIIRLKQRMRGGPKHV
jgi:uncharacterized protein (UPF0335 family)